MNNGRTTCRSTSSMTADFESGTFSSAAAAADTKLCARCRKSFISGPSFGSVLDSTVRISFEFIVMTSQVKHSGRRQMADLCCIPASRCVSSFIRTCLSPSNKTDNFEFGVRWKKKEQNSRHNTCGKSRFKAAALVMWTNQRPPLSTTVIGVVRLHIRLGLQCNIPNYYCCI